MRNFLFKKNSFNKNIFHEKKNIFFTRKKNSREKKNIFHEKKKQFSREKKNFTRDKNVFHKKKKFTGKIKQNIFHVEKTNYCQISGDMQNSLCFTHEKNL